MQRSRYAWLTDPSWDRWLGERSWLTAILIALTGFGVWFVLSEVMPPGPGRRIVMALMVPVAMLPITAKLKARRRLSEQRPDRLDQPQP